MSDGSMLFVCINYRSDTATKILIEGILARHDEPWLHLAVVNNDDELERIQWCAGLEAYAPKVLLFHPGKNLGYFGGAAWALRRYLSSRPLPSWVIVSNVDIEIPGSRFFARIMDTGGQHNHAVIAPSIVSELNGRDQNPFMEARPSAFRMKCYKRVFRYYPLLVAYNLASLLLKRFRIYRLDQDVSESRNLSGAVVPRTIYAPHGSFLIFRKSYFEAGGTLDHGAFLFGEEIFVAESVRQLGLSICYDPRLSVIHREHETTGHIPSRKIARYIGQAAAYCADKFFSGQPATTRKRIAGQGSNQSGE